MIGARSADAAICMKASPTVGKTYHNTEQVEHEITADLTSSMVSVVFRSASDTAA
jgi:hypothetical protein